MAEKKEFKQIYATPSLVREMRIIAAQRETSLRAIVDEAFAKYLETERKEEENGESK